MRGRERGKEDRECAIPACSANIFQFHLEGRAEPRFQKGLAFKAHRLVYHSTLGWRVIKKKEKEGLRSGARRK